MGNNGFMRDIQKLIIDEMGVRPEIDPAAEVERPPQVQGPWLVAQAQEWLP